MEILINIGIVIGTFLFMEFTAWFVHKYVMHGIFWFLHEDHHVIGEDKIFFEKNDWFFVIFAIPSIILFYVGTMNGFDYRFWLGTGIFIYGAAYFFVHDLFIHQRIKALTRSKNVYLMSIRKAHKMHHKHLTKEQGECFGMLLVPYKYWAEAKKSKN
ncbi:sterol desaturase family protein [uncultured Cytophaga sp.]|uniref:sterol desaturase family protein n=1 Tax=uncultured Cytophaga sp. TaxID=160238 RepID=UPI00262248B5|nr:sterol desaturase family protein [uncultured Cytophaga sp.]